MKIQSKMEEEWGFARGKVDRIVIVLRVQEIELYSFCWLFLRLAMNLWSSIRIGID